MGFQFPGHLRFVALAAVLATTILFASGSAGQAAPGSIVITKAADSATVTAGDQIGYTIAVTNGSRGRTNILVTDTLPTNPGTNWAMQPPSPNCSITAGALQCAASLAGGATFSVHIVSPTTRDTCGPGSARMVSVTNSASVRSNLGNATSQPTVITVNCPRLAVMKAADSNSVSAGDTVSYRIVAQNIGNGDARNFRLTDTLPGNLTWALDTSASDPSCAINGGQLICSPGALPGGAQLIARVVAATSSQNCGQISNSALVEATNAFPSSTGPVQITINCPSLQLQKIPDATPVNAGDQVGYTIRLTNSGPGAAHDTVLSDPLPPQGNLTWSLDTSNSALSCRIDPGQMLSCGGPGTTLTNGQSISAHVTATTSATNCPSISNSASATSSNGGQASVGPVSIAVNCLPDLVIPSITFNSTPYSNSYSYTVTVKNQGTGAANLGGVPVQGYFNSMKDNWSGDPACGQSFNAGTTLAAGASTTIVVGCSSPPLAGDNWLVVKVNYDNHIAESNSTNNVTSVALPVQLTVTKSADNNAVNAGDQVGYSITAQNTGTPNANGFTLTDQLPSGLTWEIAFNPDCSITTSGGAQTLTCGPMTLASGASVSAHVVATTSTANCPSISNTATASATGANPVSTPAVTINVTCPPDLTVQSIAFTPSVSYGDDAYTVTIKNQGAGTANLSGVVVQGVYATASDGWPGNAGACGDTIPAGTMLAPGATLDFTVGCGGAAPAGDGWLVVMVDSSNVLSEADETNNRGSVSLFSGSLTDDGLCSFTATATWHNSSPDHVFATWSVDGVATFSQDTPGSGTISGNTATFHVGPANPTGPTIHTWRVHLGFYNDPIADGEADTNIDSVACGV